ncbi:CHAT domain-containing protein [Streptomyces sp. NPDC002886]|uniref:CHAT domain-containing tetratricopeptide repeat protein n=1 Tax=Streptomyces sp. NPDC002886 TaxID=3364667 RepID=UPI003689058C
MDRAHEAEDPSAVLEPGALADARSLADFLADGEADAEVEYALSLLHLFRAQALPPARARPDYEAALRFLKRAFITVGPQAVPEELLAPLAERALPDAVDLIHRALNTPGDPALLTSAVDLARRIARHLPEDHPNHAVCLSFLAVGLRNRFQLHGDPDDLDEAVEVARAGVRSAPDEDPQRPRYLCNLATALETRFKRYGDLRDADESVEAYRAAVRDTPDGHPQRDAALTNLGVLLQARFKRKGDLGDINEAVEVHRSLLRDGSEDHPARGVILSNLCVALLSRFNRAGDLKDVDEAVEAGRAAVRATPDHDANRATHLTSLSSALRFRFQGAGALTDADEAVETGRLAVRATPDDHPDRAERLTSFGAALRMRYERTGQPTDLDEAVEAGRAAVRITPDGNPRRIDFLSELGVALVMRFERSGDLRDADDAVEANRSAVRASPDDRLPSMPLVNLCIVLLRRYERSGDLQDLNEAVDAGRAAVHVTPGDHPNRIGHLIDLAVALRLRFEHTGAARDLEEERSAWEQALEVRSAPPWMRLRALREAARLVAASDPSRAAGLLERAVLMLPEVAPRRLRRSDQQHALGTDAFGLAADATALALADTTRDASERAVRALRMAEAGRTVLLSQALDTRSDLTDLRERHPDLAQRFRELRSLLDRDPGAAPDSPASERHHLAQELEALLGRIQACEGFASFGLPPTLDDLLAEAAHGPVVTFNISAYRSDALLLTRDGITSCPLPLLSLEAVADRLEAFQQALGEATAPDGDRIAAQRTLRQVLEWLWEAAAEPVLSALGEAIPPAEEGRPLPRVWWAPGGLLGMLPLHAAGYHTDPGHGPHRRTVLDRVVSSYTPTVRTLHHARRRRTRPADGLRSLIVAMPTTPGQSRLDHVAEEARRITALLPQPVRLTEPDPVPDGTPSPVSSDTPTAAAVLALLPECGIAHFACHGSSNPADPSQSLLFLHDHAAAPLTVSALARVDLHGAQLAYLSACNTADPASFDLLDEAVHLTSAFQLAGFPRVVGTLWQIDDRLAADVAATFYEHLTTGRPGTLDPDRTAAALHHTIRDVRDRYPATPSLWAAYLHVGA